MSLKRKTAAYAGSAMVVALVVILAATAYVGSGTTSFTSTQPSTLGSTGSSGSSQVVSPTDSASSGQASSSSQGSSQSGTQSTGQSTANPDSVVIVQLTDPPSVPAGTRSLNLTYSSVTLLVGEPATSGQVTTSNVSVAPSGGSATVDLLKLENVTLTLASADLPTGSTIYSATFAVSSIAININGTVYAVALASGGSDFVVTLANASVLKGTNALLLDLNPTVVNTPSGYEMIPSSVGIMRSQSEVTSQSGTPGSSGQVTSQDWLQLRMAQGNITANLLTLSATNGTTTFTVQLGNDGSVPVVIGQLGLRGNLTVQSDGCTTTSTSTTSTSTTSSSKGGSHDKRITGTSFGLSGCWSPGEWGLTQVLFTPAVSSGSTTSTSTSSTSTTTSTSTTSAACTNGKLTLSTLIGIFTRNAPLTLAPGQCVILTFSGEITYGPGHLVLIPNTSAGQVYQINVVASNFAQVALSCTLPVSATSCTPVTGKSVW